MAALGKLVAILMATRNPQAVFCHEKHKNHQSSDSDLPRPYKGNEAKFGS